MPKRPRADDDDEPRPPAAAAAGALTAAAHTALLLRWAGALSTPEHAAADAARALAREAALHFSSAAADAALGAAGRGVPAWAAAVTASGAWAEPLRALAAAHRDSALLQQLTLAAPAGGASLEFAAWLAELHHALADAVRPSGGDGAAALGELGAASPAAYLLSQALLWRAGERERKLEGEGERKRALCCRALLQASHGRALPLGGQLASDLLRQCVTARGLVEVATILASMEQAASSGAGLAGRLGFCPSTGEMLRLCSIVDAAGERDAEVCSALQTPVFFDGILRFLAAPAHRQQPGTRKRVTKLLAHVAADGDTQEEARLIGKLLAACAFAAKVESAPDAARGAVAIPDGCSDGLSATAILVWAQVSVVHMEPLKAANCSLLAAYVSVAAQLLECGLARGPCDEAARLLELAIDTAVAPRGGSSKKQQAWEVGLQAALLDALCEAALAGQVAAVRTAVAWAQRTSTDRLTCSRAALRSFAAELSKSVRPPFSAAFAFELQGLQAEVNKER